MAAGGSNRTGACLPLELVSHASFVWPCSSLEPMWKVISSEKTSLLKVTLSGQWSSLCCYFSNEPEHPSLPPDCLRHLRGSTAWPGAGYKVDAQ